MLKGITQDGEMKNVKLSEDGKVLVDSNIVNTESIKVSVSNTPSVNVKNTQATPIYTKEMPIYTTLSAKLYNVKNSPLSISVKNFVRSISVANYSQEETVVIAVDNIEYLIGYNLATELIINKNIQLIKVNHTGSSSITIPVQIIVKGGN